MVDGVMVFMAVASVAAASFWLCITKENEQGVNDIHIENICLA